jgi:hypothetical protein
MRETKRDVQEGNTMKNGGGKGQNRRIGVRFRSRVGGEGARQVESSRTRSIWLNKG